VLTFYILFAGALQLDYFALAESEDFKTTCTRTLKFLVNGSGCRNVLKFVLYVPNCLIQLLVPNYNSVIPEAGFAVCYNCNPNWFFFILLKAQDLVREGSTFIDKKSSLCLP
jgi:hypothetical protein